MTTRLERSYGRLLRLYPAAYRRERGDEMLDALLASGATRLTQRERRALILGALRARAGASDRRGLGTTWRQSAALAAVLLMAYGAATDVSQYLAAAPGAGWRENVAAAIGLAGIALAFGRWLPAAIACAVAAYLFPTVSTGHPGITLSLEWLLAAVLLIPAAVRGGRPQWRQGYLVLLALALFDPALTPETPFGWLTLLAVVLAWTAVDERAAIACGLMLALGVTNQGAITLLGASVDPSYTATWVLWPTAMLVAGSLAARRRARL